MGIMLHTCLNQRAVENYFYRFKSKMWIVLINLFLLKTFQNQSQIYKARKLQFSHGFSPPEQAEMCTRSQE